METPWTRTELIIEAKLWLVISRVRINMLLFFPDASVQEFEVSFSLNNQHELFQFSNRNIHRYTNHCKDCEGNFALKYKNYYSREPLTADMVTRYRKL